ncbi:leucyl/phenylalanyl-tRNA--protein transferase [Kribbella sp. NPDC005582]|uniref:leucyl/phenylalanyl-tRNA--protein transferase n=1 Tax=Kribbella sp. NPDC005582 TaxID=3156893 RepID=UPI0033AA323F
MPTTDTEVATGYAELYADEIDAGLIEVVGPTAEAFMTPWWSPDPRPLIPVGQLHMDRRSRSFLRAPRGWRVTADTAFAEVVAACAEDRQPRWITSALTRAFEQLHAQGFAHSIEVWEGDRLIGGAFGIGFGTVFSLDSMFHRETRASKAALIALEHCLVQVGVEVIDAQWDSAHWRQHGAILTNRTEYLERLGGGQEPFVLSKEERLVEDICGAS